MILVAALEFRPECVHIEDYRYIPKCVRTRIPNVRGDFLTMMASRLPIADGRKGEGRSPEHKFQSRLYEPLVLLNVVNRNGERHLSQADNELSITQGPSQELRRSFLNQLAYICDFATGGETVTATALEYQPSTTVFWFASNKDISEDTRRFIDDVLKGLQRISSLEVEDIRKFEQSLARKCISFNWPRLKTYRKFLKRPLQKCLQALQGEEGAEAQQLSTWLKRFDDFEEDIAALCSFAYQQSYSREMTSLRRIAGEPTADTTDSDSKSHSLQMTRHYIGRLGSHIKAAKILVKAAQRMPRYFESFEIQTRPAPSPPCLPPPTDQQTTLEGILVRMLPKDSPRLRPLGIALSEMDHKFQILEKLKTQFRDQHFRPKVHAELILLEYFYSMQLPFVDDDRFIGCSKPACYCCYHYISHHPGGFVRPATHGIRYISWRPPDLSNPTADTLKRERILMNNVIAQIRNDALRQIELRQGSSSWHPDSTTGIVSFLSRAKSERLPRGSLYAGITVNSTQNPQLPLLTTAPQARVEPSYSSSDERLFDASVDDQISDTDDSDDSDGGAPL